MGTVYHVMSGRGDKKYKFRGPFTKSDAEDAAINFRKSNEEFCKRKGMKFESHFEVEAVEASDELVSILDRAAAHKGVGRGSLQISQSIPDPAAAREGEGDACVGCGSSQIGHSIGRSAWCCRCYVLTGNAPADWHPRCMATYLEMKAKP